ncbi:AAA family ATPase, partial [Filifactor alocis]|uniref:AAA family ATPase n=1 Tax=Filifactor alocis TaxID=143361 RepID=UPI003C6FA795
MKPIKLTLSGFITYRDTQTIDFTKFEQGSLFIVSGATGSGKTTIFDAICFALYGKISSQTRGEGEELRSQYLSPEDDKTFVEFEFEENGERIRIRREPRQVMKRPRGKIDTVSEEVELYLGNEVMTSKREVDEKIVELTGLTWDQFTKIVMLPQGEFRKFLSASSKEKEEILRKIFDTVPYQRFLEQVKQKYSMIQKKFEKMEDEVNALVSILDLEESACIQEFLKDNRLEPAFYLKALENMVQEQEKNRKETEEIEESLKKFEQQYQHCKNQISMANRHNTQLSQFQQKQEELGKLIPLEQEMKKRKEACIQAEKALSFYREEVRLESVSDRIQQRNEELEQLIQEETLWEEKSVAAKKEAEKIPYLSEEEEKKVKELEEWNQKEEQYGRLQEILHQEKEFEVQKRKLEQEKIKIQTSLKECEEVLRSLEKIGEKFE